MPRPGEFKTRFGPQPARSVILVERCRSLRWVAQQIDVDYTHLINACSGRTTPSAELRLKLPALLGVPVTRLFTAEALKHLYGPDEREASPDGKGVRRGRT